MDKLLCIQQPVRPLQDEIDLSWQDDAVGDAVPADEAVEEAEPADAVEVIGASEDERKENHVESIDDEIDDEKNDEKNGMEEVVEEVDDEKNDEKNEAEEVVEGEKDEEQIAEETDIKNKWSESEEERKKKQAMRRSDELIKLQTKPMQLRSKQAAYEVDPEMDEGEEKITRQLPAGAVGALKAFKELQRGFPWKQKWNGKEAEAPPKKKWRPDDSWWKKDDSWWKKDANFQGGQDWRNKPAPPPPPAKKARPVHPAKKAQPSQPAKAAAKEVAARSAPAKQPRNIMVPKQPTFPPPPPKPPTPLPPTPPAVPRPAASGPAGSSGSSGSASMPKGARRCPKGGYYLPNNVGYVDPYGQFHMYLGLC